MRRCDEFQYHILFPSIQCVAFKRSLRGTSTIENDTRRTVVQRSCLLYIFKPVYWSAIDTIMRSFAAISATETDQAWIKGNDVGTQNPSSPSPMVVDNIWQIDFKNEGQLIPDQKGPYDATKFSIDGCYDPRFLFVQLDDAASAKLSIETLKGLLRLSGKDGDSSYGAVGMRPNCDLIPKCFSAVSPISSRKAQSLMGTLYTRLTSSRLWWTALPFD